MIARDTGRLIVLSAFVALCAIVLFSSETEARGYGDVSPYAGSVKRPGGKYVPGVVYRKGFGRGRKRFGVGWKGRKNRFLKKFGGRQNRKGYGKRLGQKMRKRFYGLRKRGKGRKYRGLWKGSKKVIKCEDTEEDTQGKERSMAAREEEGSIAEEREENMAERGEGNTEEKNTGVERERNTE